MFGRLSRMRRMPASSSGTRFSRPSMSSRNAVASASSAAVSAPVRLPWPISLASALRRACFSCKAVWAARRSASSAISSAATGGSPRRAIAASNAAGSARMARMSCMGSDLYRLRFDPAGADDGDFVKRDQRHRQAGLGDDVRRRQDRGDDEHTRRRRSAGTSSVAPNW